jgi:hypothetical protein
MDEHSTIGLDGVVPHVQTVYIKCFVDDLCSAKSLILILNRRAKPRYLIYTTPHKYDV